MSEDKSEIDRDDETSQGKPEQDDLARDAAPPQTGSLRINTNISGLRATTAKLKRSNEQLSKSLERLSKGMAIGCSPPLPENADGLKPSVAFRYDASGRKICLAEDDEQFDAEF